MPTNITFDDVRHMVAAGAALVDVLPAKEYAEMHLPGAISLPLTTLDAQTTAQFPTEQPMIVYCNDFQ